MADSSSPSDAALLERAQRLANDAIHAVALQRRRIGSTEPEDDTFVMRWWADLQFMIVALRRLRRAAELASRNTTAGPEVRAALTAFDAALPSIKTMRNVGEHIDSYALDSPRRHDKAIDRRQLEVGEWDGTTFRWLRQRDGRCHKLNTTEALAAAERLYDALRRAALPRADVS